MTWTPTRAAEAARSGTATPDGRLPIEDVGDVVTALLAAGRTPDIFGSVTHIARRGRELGLTAATMRRLTPVAEEVGGALGRVWDPGAHPRGKDGRFIEVGAFVHLFDGERAVGSGRVVGFADGKVVVRDGEAGGADHEYDYGQVESVGVKAHLPTSGPVDATWPPINDRGKPMDYGELEDALYRGSTGLDADQIPIDAEGRTLQQAFDDLRKQGLNNLFARYDEKAGKDVPPTLESLTDSVRSAARKVAWPEGSWNHGTLTAGEIIALWAAVKYGRADRDYYDEMGRINDLDQPYSETEKLYRSNSSKLAARRGAVSMALTKRGTNPTPRKATTPKPDVPEPEKADEGLTTVLTPDPAPIVPDPEPQPTETVEAVDPVDVTPLARPPLSEDWLHPDPEQVKTLSPKQIDVNTEQTWIEHWAAATDIALLRDRIRRNTPGGEEKVGERPAAWRSDNRPYVMGFAEVLEAYDPDNNVYDRRQSGDLRAEYLAARERAQVAEDAQDVYDQEFARRGGWTRAFLVTSSSGGHVHKSQSCSTCRPGHYRPDGTWSGGTEFIWLPEYASESEDRIVGDAGERACTACYPTAPVDVLSRGTKIFSPDERKAAEERELRNQAKIERAAQARANAPTVDGTPLRVQERSGYRPELKTERAALNWWSGEADDLKWSWLDAKDKDQIWSQLELIVSAIAEKRGVDPDEVRAGLVASHRKKTKKNHQDSPFDYNQFGGGSWIAEDGSVIRLPWHDGTPPDGPSGPAPEPEAPSGPAAPFEVPGAPALDIERGTVSAFSPDAVKRVHASVASAREALPENPADIGMLVGVNPELRRDAELRRAQVHQMRAEADAWEAWERAVAARARELDAQGVDGRHDYDPEDNPWREQVAPPRSVVKVLGPHSVREHLDYAKPESWMAYNDGNEIGIREYDSPRNYTLLKRADRLRGMAAASEEHIAELESKMAGTWRPTDDLTYRRLNESIRRDQEFIEGYDLWILDVEAAGKKLSAESEGWTFPGQESRVPMPDRLARYVAEGYNPNYVRELEKEAIPSRNGIGTMRRRLQRAKDALEDDQKKRAEVLERAEEEYQELQAGNESSTVDKVRDGGPGDTTVAQLGAVVAMGQAIEDEVDAQLVREGLVFSELYPDHDEVQRYRDLLTEFRSTKQDAFDEAAAAVLAKRGVTNHRDYVEAFRQSQADFFASYIDSDWQREYLDAVGPELVAWADRLEKHLQTKSAYAGGGSTVSDKRQQYYDRRRELYTEMLRSLGVPFGPPSNVEPPYVFGDGGKRVGLAETDRVQARTIRKGLDRMPTGMIEAAWGDGKVVEVATRARGSRSYSTLSLPDKHEAVSTLVHEEHHAVEDRAPFVKRLEWAMLTDACYEGEIGSRRTKKGTAKQINKYRKTKLSTVHPRGGYGEYEVAYRDEFYEAYVGKVYDSYGWDTDRIGSETSNYEMLTMTAEAVLGDRKDFVATTPKENAEQARRMRAWYLGIALLVEESSAAANGRSPSTPGAKLTVRPKGEGEK